MELTYKELIEKRSQLEEEINSYIEKVEVEKRFLNEDETSIYESRKNELSEVVDKLLEIEKLKNENDKEIRNINKNNNKKEMTNFSLLSILRETIDGKNYSEENRALIAQGAEITRSAGILINRNEITVPLEQRDLTATTAQSAITTEPLSISTALRAALVTPQLGATMLTGISSNMSLPLLTGPSAAWAAESASITPGSSTVTGSTLVPIRLSVQVPVSNLFLTQTAPVGAEQMVIQDIVNALAVKLESTMFSADAGVANAKPAGLANGATLVDASTWAGVVGLEGKVGSDNMLAGNLAYVTNNGGVTYFKTNPKVAGYPSFIMESDGTMNGYKTLVTNNVPKYNAKNGIVFGDFSKLVIAQWGALTIKIDDLTQAVADNTIITVTGYFNYGLKDPKALVFGTIN